MAKNKVTPNGVCAVCGYRGRTENGRCIVHEESLTPDEIEFLDTPPCVDDGTELVTGVCDFCDEEVTNNAVLCPPCRDWAEQALGDNVRLASW